MSPVVTRQQERLQELHGSPSKTSEASANGDSEGSMGDTPSNKEKSMHNLSLSDSNHSHNQMELEEGSVLEPYAHVEYGVTLDTPDGKISITHLHSTLSDGKKSTSHNPASVTKKLPIRTILQSNTLPSPSDRQTYSNILFRVAICLTFLVVLIGLFLSSETQQKEENPSSIREILEEKVETPLSRFIKSIQQLKKRFPRQHRRLWTTLNATTKRIIKDKHPIQPVVILIGSTNSARKEADCIAQQFSKVVTEAFQSVEPVYVNVSKDYRSMTPEDAKVALEQSLRSGFSAGARSAVISNLEDLQGRTAMLLHAFCDNDNAPFTKVVIAFTIHIDMDVLSERYVEDYLTNIWRHHLNIDDISALLSRVANNVVIARKEDDWLLKETC